MKITTNMVGNESAAVRQTRLKSVYDWYKGDGAYVAAGNLGVVRAAFNEYLASDIANLESFASWAVKFNILNSHDTWIRTQLFGSGAKGVWFDPNDLPTLTQDSAGTVPVTAAGQPVGRMLDKSGNAAHATQAVAAKRPICGVIPKGGRRNLLTYSEDFANAIWNKTGSTIIAGAALDPDGTMTASKLVESAAAQNHILLQSYSVAASTVYVASRYIKAAERGFAFMGFNGDPLAAFASVNLSTGATSTVSGALVDHGAESAGGGWWRVWIKGTTTVAGELQADVRTSVDGVWANRSYLGDGTSGVYTCRAQVDVTALTPYQRVGSVYDITESGVPSLQYLASDLIDDELPAAVPSLGSNATVWFANQGETVVLPNQTVPLGNLATLRGARTFAMGAIDRPLTVSETSWLTQYLNKVRGIDFTPADLFTRGEAGIWQDSRTLATLTQDSAGATPVSAAGQPVGRALDKSGNAAHATQAVAAKRPICGVIPKGGRRNILPKTTQMHGGAPWSGILSSLAANGDSPPIADPAQSVKVVPDSGSVAGSVSVSVNFAAGMHTISFYAKADGMSKVSLVTDSDGAFKSTVFDLASVTTSGTPAGWTVSIVSVGGGWFRCNTSMVSVGGARGVRFANIGTGITGDGTIGYLIAAPQIETGSVATPYQRVVSDYEIYESGVPSLPYLASDLIDDELPATVPSLGSNATVWFAVDGASTILAGQTVAAGPVATLRGARTYAMGAINRPLTTGETAALTAYLNKERGAL